MSPRALSSKLTLPRRRLLAAFRRLKRVEAPSIRVLARETGRSVGSIQYGIGILVRLGLVERVPEPGRGYRLTNGGAK